MLKQPMIEKLAAMRLLGMVEALKAQEQDPSARELSFLERFGLLVDQQWNWRSHEDGTLIGLENTEPVLDVSRVIGARFQAQS